MLQYQTMLTEMAYLPTSLGNQVKLLHQEILLGTLGINLTDYRRYPQCQINNTAVEKFSTSITNNDLHLRLKRHIKINEKMPEGKFGLLPITQPGQCYDYDKRGYTYSDGMQGFLLSYTKPDGSEIRLVATSFSNPNKLPNTLPWQEIDTKKLIQNSIVILQLQSHIYYPNQQNGQILLDREVILQKFRWEHFLVELSIDFASNLGLKAVYLQPASLNNYYTSEKMNRFKMRYDVTAQRMNFLKRQEDGIFELLL